MGFFGELKKLFFAQKSVAKSAAKKAKDQGEEWIDEAKEQGEEWVDQAKSKGGELYDNAKERTEDWADQAKKKSNEWKDKVEDKLDDLMDSFDAKEEETDPEITHSGIPAAPKQSIPREKSFMDKLGEKAEELGDKALDSFEEASESAKDLSEDVGEKIHKAKEDIVQKSKEAADYLDKKLDETVEKAKKLDAQIEAESNDKDQDGFADTPVDISSSELEGKDDFFAKAEAFAEGRPMEDAEKDIKITPGTPEDKPEYKTYGFEDRDGDGDELIDDAIIEEE